ncbi:MAG: GDP-mannose 4,6-dehydratase [Gaiellaceae bacterium]
MRTPLRGTAIVTGATGQDGFYLVQRLLEEGWTVHAPVRDVEAADALFQNHERFIAVKRDLRDPGPLTALIGDIRPEELYNLAGESSVSNSFDDPRATWETNAHVVVHLLDAVRKDSPGTRVYQASSGEMFGSVSGGAVVHNESSAMNPQSPYAAAKAAAHLLCGSYRDSYGVRVACGVLFNHESHRRDSRFLSRKVVDHVRMLEMSSDPKPLFVGNLKAQRDWGFAPDYVDGMIKILRQAAVRGDADQPHAYRDYVLGSGCLQAVWQLIDAAFRLVGHELRWDLEAEDPTNWRATFVDSGELAVAVDRTFVRPSDPQAIAADASRIEEELGWQPRVGLEVFLRDMLEAPAPVR